MPVTAENLNLSAPLAPLTSDPALVAQSAPESVAADQYRVLLRRIDRAAAIRPIRTVAITSCARGEGRSTVAANLALTAARAGREACLVEADLKRPTLSRLFELAPRAGIGEVADGRAELAQAIVRAGNLAVLTAGDPRDVEATLRSARLGATLDALRAAYPLVVIDAPPAFALSDAGRFGGYADALVLVVRAGATPRDAVRMAVDALGDRLLGIVLNGIEEPGYARYLHEDRLSA